MKKKTHTESQHISWCFRFLIQWVKVGWSFFPPFILANSTRMYFAFRLIPYDLETELTDRVLGWVKACLATPVSLKVVLAKQWLPPW